MMNVKRKKDPLAEEAWRALIHHIKGDPSRAGAIKRIFSEMDTDGSGNDTIRYDPLICIR